MPNLNTGRTLSESLTGFRHKVEERSLMITREALKNMTIDIVSNTPVLTGRLRGGWRAGIGKSIGRTERGLDPLGAGAHAEIRQTLQNLKVGDLFQFVNRVYYAKFVEFGTSQISPRNFLRGPLSMWRHYIEDAARKIKK